METRECKLVIQTSRRYRQKGWSAPSSRLLAPLFLKGSSCRRRCKGLQAARKLRPKNHETLHKILPSAVVDRWCRDWHDGYFILRCTADSSKDLNLPVISNGRTFSSSREIMAMPPPLCFVSDWRLWQTRECRIVTHTSRHRLKTNVSRGILSITVSAFVMVRPW